MQFLGENLVKNGKRGDFVKEDNVYLRFASALRHAEQHPLYSITEFGLSHFNICGRLIMLSLNISAFLFFGQM